jgi:transcriptional regulator GlxA family with amidase domain
MQVAIVIYQGMTTLDVIDPYEVIRFLTNVDLRFVSNQVGPVVTDSGILVLGATHSFDETPKPDLILIGGSEANTATAMAEAELISWLKKVHETSTWTVSVCTGALTLGAAGILDGHPATTHWLAQSGL